MLLSFPSHIKYTLLGFLLPISLLSTSIPAAHSVEAKALLDPAPNVKKHPLFKTILKAKQGSKVYEGHRIEYLLNRMMRSSCIFIRNGEKHVGKTAAMHMRWKYKMYQKEVVTAKDFIEKIANGSRKTRETYKIQLPDGQIYPSQDILSNELELLDRELESAKAQPAAL